MSESTALCASSAPSGSSKRAVRFSDPATGDQAHTSYGLSSNNSKAHSPGKVKTLLTRKELVAAMNDIRGRGVEAGLPADQIDALEKRLLSLHPLEPIPSEDEVVRSRLGMYYYGFYMRDCDIHEFAAIWNNTYRPRPGPAAVEDMEFIEFMLTWVMNKHKVVLKYAYVTERHKEQFPEIEEPVGGQGYIMVILSTDQYDRGFRPTSREIHDMTTLVGREPAWFEAAD